MQFGWDRMTILFAFVIPLVAIIGGLMLGALKILKGSPGKGSKEREAEETKMVQAIYHQLSQMEDRIEALETLLIDRERKEGRQ